MKYKFMSMWLFLGVIFLFFAGGFFLPEKNFSESENRYLDGKPEFTFSKLLDGSFGTEYESYLSDQFPMRKQFVSLKTNMERVLFKEDVNGVYFGDDHYYIEKFEPETLFTEQLNKNLGFIKTAVEQFGEKLGNDRVKVMLVPSASQILTDKLPAFAAPADQSKVTKRLKESLESPSMVLPIEEVLLKHRDEKLYYMTDHHWTSLGAYYAYCLYGEAAGFGSLSESSFQKETVTDGFLGTIESKVQTGMVPDEIILYLLKEQQEYSVFYDGLPKAHDNLYNKEALKSKDKYAVFLDGNHGLTKIINNNLDTGRKLLIIKDSYAHSFAPFTANHFDEVHMVDLRYFNMKISDYMDGQNITDVLVLYQIPGFAKDENIFKVIN